MTQNPDDRSVASVDGVLQILTKSANESGFSLGLTLSVGGFLISGQLLGINEYYDQIAKDFEQGTGNGVDAFAHEFRRLAQEGRSKVESTVSEGVEDLPLPSFIHLGDARVFHPAGTPIPADRGTTWRIRLSAIDGFVFGTLSA